MNTGRNMGGYGGGVGDGIVWAVVVCSFLYGNSEVWNGSGWSEVNDLNTSGTCSWSGSSNVALPW